MLRYALERLLTAIPTLLLLITLAFFLIRLAPGGPFDAERALSPEIEQNLNQLYHLDEPLPLQYFRYLGQILRLDFGPSFQYRDWTVNQLIAQGFPVSLTIGGLALLLGLLAGVLIGMLAALRQNHWLDYLLMSLAMAGLSIPAFVLAPILVLLFAVHFGWLPAGGWEWRLQYMLLPILTLAMPLVAYVARLTRASMIEVMRTGFIRTARAKGLPLHQIVLRHAWKPALLPVVSYLGPAAAAVITGSVVIEKIFTIPGLGTYFVQGALNRDYTLVLGVVIFYGMLIILFNLLVDLLYAWMDPQIHLDSREGY
ncbi:MAG: oligopeptide ABC transporter permease OppB [Gammaproteobacteria bacterium]|nr:oligopeptide ABC transporter permease OppB [Gammaproteobacteria bacterium]